MVPGEGQIAGVRNPPRFLLVDNGSNANRGCEAILRGTVAILKREFGEGIRITNACLGSEAEVTHQNATEADPCITHVSLMPRYRRWSRNWVRRRLCALVQGKAPKYLAIDALVPGACLALALGGDNYSLDYGRPELYLSLGCRIVRRSLPLVLWGASVGPFEADPEFAPLMLDHLRTLAAITVRESVSLEYLRRNGLSANVHRVADPAFAMEPREPAATALGFEMPGGAVGINLSALMARHVTGGDMESWIGLCVSMVTSLAEKTDRAIVLIPHVASPDESNDDYLLARRVATQLDRNRGSRIFCADRALSAAETKWVISRCCVFAGMRTHSTIAAFSTGVPTLSFAYSVKARGLNQDIFGSLDYCLEPDDIRPDAVTAHVLRLLDHEAAIRAHLNARVPQLVEAAYAAGPILREILRNAGAEAALGKAP